MRACNICGQLHSPTAACWTTGVAPGAEVEAERDEARAERDEWRMNCEAIAKLERRYREALERIDNLAGDRPLLTARRIARQALSGGGDA